MHVTSLLMLTTIVNTSPKITAAPKHLPVEAHRAAPGQRHTRKVVLLTLLPVSVQPDPSPVSEYQTSVTVWQT